MTKSFGRLEPAYAQSCLTVIYTQYRNTFNICGVINDLKITDVYSWGTLKRSSFYCV